MLHYRTVAPETLELLKKLQAVPEFSSLRLVGGTGLALQYGHRKSVDIDLFGRFETKPEELSKILSKIGQTHNISLSDTINIFTVNGIKTDVVNYSYEWLREPIIEDGILLASDVDIAAMKLAAISNRGSKKDFIDVFCILKKYSLKEILGFYTQKYPAATEFIVLKSLIYFEDAESEPMPFIFDVPEWEEVKRTIKKTVVEY